MKKKQIELNPEELDKIIDEMTARLAKTGRKSLSDTYSHTDDHLDSVEVKPMKKITATQMRNMPVIVLDDAIAVPDIHQQLPVYSEEQLNFVKNCIAGSTPVVIVPRLDRDAASPDMALSDIGVVGYLVDTVDPDKEINPDALPLMLFMGQQRVKVNHFMGELDGSPLFASVKSFPIKIDIPDDELRVYLEEMQEVYDNLLKINRLPDFPTMSSVLESYPLMAAFYFAIFTGPVDLANKDRILHMRTLSEMLVAYGSELHKLRKAAIIKEDIRKKAEQDMQEINRDNFLRQQMSVIRDELGEGMDEIEEFRRRAETKKWNEATRKHFDRELMRLQRFPSNSPDYSIQSTYIDNFLSLPWGECSDSDFDFNRVADVLDRDHFGLEKVKERILEQMAVAKLRDDNKAPILCLVGPPGVGKTSLGRSIAEAMEREYARVSFGGMHDEAEIRGHRRTYLGAMPGRIIGALIKTSTSNPVMVLDEIDKIGKDFKGDPSTALLEVLDPEQNSAFHDNYLDADYDLSNIFFIATANSLDTISAPLRDRMEIIAIPGYITAEKIEIGSRHLVPKQLKANGFPENEITFEHDALEYIIDYYTRESGVRRLEKMIAKVLRRLAVKKVRGEEYPTVITRELVGSLLGKTEFNPDMYESNHFTGVVTGLAWTSVGGEILFIEASVTEGKGKLTLTGNLGDVMKESATLALQYLRANASILDLTTEQIDKSDVHIHVPEGAIPKDGPSAGITMTTAIASALTGRKVKPRLAMTGEITLRGKVLPVGGIKEKIIAAKRAGITEIILCRDNEKDINEIADRYVEGLSFHYVDTIKDVLDEALV